MNDRLNKTSICSIIFLDIIDYSKQPVSEQIAHKEHFNSIIREAVKDVAPNDLIILDTGDGAAIALLGSPEDAIFVSLTIRDGMVAYNNQQSKPCFVRIGLNLGPVRIVNDINGHANIIGDGINVAQRIMSFAEPNQILVSRSYYEITSRLTDELTQLFAYSGVRHDKHVREHEVYAIRPPTESVTQVTDEVTEPVVNVAAREKGNNYRAIGTILISVLATAVVVGLYFNRSQTTVPGQPVEATVPGVATATVVPVNQPAILPSSHEDMPVKPDLPLEKKPDTVVADTPPAKPKAKKPPAKAAETQLAKKSETTHKPEPIPEKAAEPVPEPHQEKSGWEQFKDGFSKGTSETRCSQAERALNQCR